MTVEYFGRQYEITPAIRDEVESGLGKLIKILGDNIKSKVILTVEKHRNIAEITVKRRRGHLVGLAEATDMLAAVNQALEHIETQVLKYNGRRRATHRKPKDKGWKAPVEAQAETQMAVGGTAVDRGARGGAQVSRRRAHYGGPPGAHQRCRGHASHDGRRSGKGM